MKRTQWMHGALAIVAVVLAYLAWMEPSQRAGKLGEITVLPGSADQLSRVQWEEKSWSVTISRAENKALEVSVTRRANDKDTSGQTSVFPGSAAAVALMERLAPLKAKRALGKVPAEKLPSLGLEDGAGAGELTLTLGGTDHVLRVGNATYGTGDLYMRTAQGEAYLVGTNVFSNIRHGAGNLQDKNVVRWDMQRVERVEIGSGDKRVELVQRFADDPSKAFWAAPGAPDEQVIAGTNLVKRLVRMRIAKLGKGKPQASPQIAATFFDANGKAGTVSLWAPDGDTAFVTCSSFPNKTLTVSKALATSVLDQVDATFEQSTLP